MKKQNIFLLGLLCIIIVGLLVCCSPIDDRYGVSSAQDETTSKVTYPKRVEVPKIKSTDTVMPLYFDISLYDEENYSKIYLGKKYLYFLEYGGYTLSVPTTYDNLVSLGWQILDAGQFDADSIIRSGFLQKVVFVNNDLYLTAYFHNEDEKSVLLKDCKITRLAIEENHVVSNSKNYGDFSLNGITNSSAVTDLFFMLGAPSHFHADTETQYTLDWFKYEKDRRDKITISVDTENDCITYLAISAYK